MNRFCGSQISAITFCLFLLAFFIHNGSCFLYPASPHKNVPISNTGYSSRILAPALNSNVEAGSDADASAAIGSEKCLGDDQVKLTSLLDNTLRPTAGNISTLLMEQIEDLRKSGAQDELESCLNGLLDIIEDSTSRPWWCRFRIAAKFSRRARRASLSRVMHMSTPSADVTEQVDDMSAERRRRRRALVVVLRSLSTSSGTDDTGGKKKKYIADLERAAAQDAKNLASSEDITSRLPPGLETPKYEVVTKRSSKTLRYEVRNYEAFSICSVSMSKPRPNSAKTDEQLSEPQLAGASSFGALAGYLFGKNQEGKAMKMTTPVLTQGEDENKQMSFVLPSDYWGPDGLAQAPSPLDDSLVQLNRDNGGTRATLVFGGFATKKDAQTQKEKLLKALEVDPDWVAVENTFVTLAQYNDPFTPPWKRRNEVSIPVKVRQR